VSRYDAATGVREEGIDRLACAIASGERVLWIAGCPFVNRLSTDDGHLRELTKQFLPFRDPANMDNGRVQFRELAIGGGSLWVLGDALDRRLWRLDERTGEIEATIELGFPPVSAVYADGVLWVTDNRDDRVVPVDAATNRPLAPVRVGRGPTGIAAGAGAVWVANTLAGTLSRLDPAARRVVETVHVGPLPRGVAYGDGAIWVTAHA
jgi:YVTN family beta-propeller protein